MDASQPWPIGTIRAWSGGLGGRVAARVDAVYVRSVRGTRGRWYREARAYPEAVLHAGARQLPVHIEPISDAATIGRVSETLLRKYAQWPNDARAMVRDEVLPTTLRLHPAEASS